MNLAAHSPDKKNDENSGYSMPVDCIQEHLFVKADALHRYSRV
jgi:hypothetical protein